MDKTPFCHTIPMLYSRSHVLMGENMKRFAERDERKGENASSMWALYHGHMYLAYKVISDGKDFEIDKKEEDYR